MRFSGPSPTEAVPFNAASLAKARARSSAAAVKKLLLPCRGVPAEAAKVVQFNAASQAKARARPSAAVAVVVRRAETAEAAEVHHKEDKFTT